MITKQALGNTLFGMADILRDKMDGHIEKKRIFAEENSNRKFLLFIFNKITLAHESESGTDYA